MAGQWHGGKGSKPRPYSVSQTEFDNRWDLIFKKKETTDESSSMEQESMPILRSSKKSSQDEGN
jgi:hypothetical protein